MLSSEGQHGAEQQLQQDKDPTKIPVQLNKEGEEVFVKVDQQRLTAATLERRINRDL